MFEKKQKQSSSQSSEPDTQGSSPVPSTETKETQSAVPVSEPLTEPKTVPPVEPDTEIPVPEAAPETVAELPQQEPVATTQVQPEQPEDILESVSSSPPVKPDAEIPVPEPQPEAGLAPEADTAPLEEVAKEPVVPMPSEVPTPEQPISALSQPSATKFATPELAKKEIIQKADEGGDSEKEIIRVMADKFRKSKPKKSKSGKKKGNLLIILLVVVILIIAGGLGYYFWAEDYFQKSAVPESQPEAEVKEPQPEAGPPQAEVEPIEEEEPQPEAGLPLAEVLSPIQTLRDELQNAETGVVISWAEIYLPEGAVETDINLEIKGELVSEESEGDYKIIGGLYQVSSQKIETNIDIVLPDIETEEETKIDIETEDDFDVIFKKTANLRIFYSQDLIEDTWEQDLVLGYFKDNFWTPLSSSLDIEANTLSIDIDLLPSKILAVIVAKEKITPKIEMFQIAPEIQSSLDTDSDGLTDVEERLYRTEVNNPDSDADTTPDGQEILKLTEPNQQAEGAQLAASGLINVYTNPTYSYSFFYPSSWLARALPETNNQEVLVITNTGEFFSITVENNPEELSPVEWYLRQSPSVDESLLYSTIVNNQEAVWNQEHLTLYISKDSRVYILSYNVGTEREANFKTSFELMINSFQFVVQPQGRADGTLVQYPDQPEVYLIESGKKRAFVSGEIFVRIGFKWEDIIEIPYSETYIDGDPVTGRLDGTLIKYPDQPGVYLIEFGTKRAFASGQVFEALGFKWDDLIEILENEIYPDGPIIDSHVTSVPSRE